MYLIDIFKFEMVLKTGINIIMFSSQIISSCFKNKARKLSNTCYTRKKLEASNWDHTCTYQQLSLRCDYLTYAITLGIDLINRGT